MRKSHRVILIVLFFIFSAFAQEKTVQGKVIGSDNKPLIGANIVVQGTTTGTTTDNDGFFSLTVEALPVTLLFSYVGYTDRAITVYDESPLSVLLTESIYGAEDVTVVGSRFRPRTSITSPVPVDNIKVRDLETTS
ncbi:MAG: TonB-dependent receptor, partial [Candidatus Brocadia sp. WS118]